MIPKPRRPGRARPLADFVAPTLGAALAKQGFSGSDILQSWAAIVGERLAAVSQPMRVAWPRRAFGDAGASREPATLVIRVEGAFALELQHLAPIVTERVNAYYGWRCVGRLVLKQGPVREDRPRPPASRPLDPDEVERVAASLDGIAADPLREALDRLGRAVLSDTRDAASDGQDGVPMPHSSHDKRPTSEN